MPTPDQLLPTVDVGELKLGSAPPTEVEELRARYNQWTPPQETAGQLLTPSSASNREEKRQAVAAALAANPDASDRAIGREAGVDHHTVGKLRGQAGEVPTEGDAAGGGDR